MTIEYKSDKAISAEQFIDLLNRSTLGERRPVDNQECMEGMVKNTDLMITAWDKDTLVGLARSVTDFHYACYLSDLAVDVNYQKSGIGKQLQILTQEKLGPECNLILIAAPAANDYYNHIGFNNNERCWILGRNEKIS